MPSFGMLARLLNKKSNLLKISSRSLLPYQFSSAFSFTTNMSITHDPKSEKFVYKNSKNEIIGYLEYESFVSTERQQVLDLVHTVIQPSGRGSGIGAKLCDFAFAYAKDEGKLLVPTCSYIRDNYMKKHPEHEALVYKEDI